jgi:hypothetical protein
MISELEGKRSWPNLNRYPCIFLEGNDKGKVLSLCLTN